MQFRFLAAPALLSALALMASPAQAQAQVNDLDPETISAVARYALPSAFDGYMERCSASLDRSGYANSNARSLRAKFSNGVDRAWPEARQAMLRIASREAGDMGSLFDLMSDDDLRPFIDGMIENLVSQEIKQDECRDIERGLEILDPLPADNVARLVGFLVEMGQRDEGQERTLTIPPRAGAK